MRKLNILLLFIACTVVMDAQLTLQASVSGGYNTADNFSAFREKYNTLNEASLDNNLGAMRLFEGYNIEASYRILGLSTTIMRSYLHSGTSAKYKNDAKRLIDINYKLTYALIGAGFNTGEKSQMRIEVGMIHSVSSLYSCVKYPTGEYDYNAGGASHQSTYSNVGLAARVSYMKFLSEKILVYASVLYNRINSDDLGIAPQLEYYGTNVSHSFKGFTANVGIGYTIFSNDF